MNGFLRQPLLHFLILGALLCGIFAVFAGPRERPADDQVIAVSSADIDALIEGWTRTWKRPPTADELVGLVEVQVAEEVYVREALALGLDRDDTIVRRRLQQKLEFLGDDLMALPAPDEQTLQAFLDDHAASYAVPAAVSFIHVYFNPDRHGQELDADVAQALAALQSGAPPETVGDPFLLPMAYRDEPVDLLERTFGGDLAAAMSGHPVGQWFGPVASGFGLHLVRIDDLVITGAPDLATVRAAVERDWYDQQRQAARDAFFKSLAQQYDLEIAWPEGFTPPRPVWAWQP